MGIEGFFRKVCEELVPDAFYPRDKAGWPDMSDVTVMIDDVNSRVRAYPICVSATDELLSYGLKTWGDLVGRLEAEYLKFFSQGIKTIVVTFDGRCPLAKEVEQTERKENWYKTLEKEHRKPYEWPPVSDVQSEEFRSQRWFRDTDRIAMGFNDIYYHLPSKIQFLNYLTEFLAHHMALPTDCKIIVDSGVFKNIVMTHPIQISIEWAGQPVPVTKDSKGKEVFDIDQLADYGPTPETQYNPDCWERRIEDVEGEPPYWTYCEADDRLIFWIHRHAHSGIIVCSEDGDTMLSLMATHRSRAEAGHLRRLYLRRMDRVGTLADRTPVKQSQIIDINRLADAMHTLFGGLMIKGAERILHQLSDNHELDGVLLFCLLVLMRPNDYSNGFTGAGPLNLFRAAVARPDLCAKMLVVQTHDHEADGLDKFKIPVTVLIQLEPFRAFVDTVYRQGYMLRERADGYMRPDIYESRYPRPDDDMVRATAARISWTLNKLCNGGRPLYKIPLELRMERGTDLPVFGYHQAEELVHDPVTSQVVKKRVIKHSERVAKRVYYGERHQGLTTIPETGIGLDDRDGDREAERREREQREKEERYKKEREQAAKDKRRDQYQAKKQAKQSMSVDQDQPRGSPSSSSNGRGRGGGRGGGGYQSASRDVYFGAGAAPAASSSSSSSLPSKYRPSSSSYSRPGSRSPPNHHSSSSSSSSHLHYDKRP